VFSLISFFALLLFLGQTQTFGLVYSRIKDFESTWSSQNQVKRFRPCLAANVFVEVFLV